MTSIEPRKILLYLHTHWDREWYRSFEAYRFRLCRTLLAILDYLDADSERVFMLDGQTVVLEDFLAIYPEQAARIQTLIAAGRLQVGPWYVLPDEFLVSGEALIRNLQWGTTQARAWGQRRFGGYLPDMFGHLAQMPLLLAQSGLAPAVVWRGVVPESTYFLWEALDGTQLPTVHLTQGYYQDALHQSPPAWDLLEQTLSAIAAATPPELPLLLPVGADHMGLPPELDARLREAQERFPDYAFELSDLASYLQLLEAQAPEMTAAQDVQRGELHRPHGLAYVLPGVWSTRRYLKQANDAVQNLLEREVEPVLVYQFLSGNTPERALLWQAWKYLLQNHPHDSICGCSIDEVHQDMLPRFRWAREIARELQVQAWQDWGGYRHDQTGPMLNLLNSGPADYQGVLDVSVNFTADKGVKAFDLLDEEGLAWPYEIVRMEEREVFVAEPEILPHWEPLHQYHCRLEVRLPALTCRSLRIVPSKRAQALLAAPKAGPEQSIENRYCKLTWDPRSGQIQLYRKEEQTWIEVAEGHIFVSEGDAGDSYNYSPPQQDQVVELSASSSRVDCSALSQKMVLNYYGALPARLQDDRQRRAGLKVPMRIETSLTLYKDERCLHVQVRVQNQARDHRLRLIWKTPFQHLRCMAATAFGAVPREFKPEYPIDVPKGQERPVETFPFTEWIHLSAPDNDGWALQSEGVHEAALTHWEGRAALSLTLLRSVGWLSRDDLRTRGGGAGPHMPTPEAQCLGEHLYDYVIHLCGNDLQQALSALNARRFPIQAFQGQQPRLASLFELQPGLLHLSALTLSQDQQAVVVRLVNESQSEQDFVLCPRFACLRASQTEPLEQRETPCSTLEQRGTLAAGGMVTFKFYPDGADISGAANPSSSQGVSA